MSEALNARSQIIAATILSNYLKTDFADEDSSQIFFEYLSEQLSRTGSVDMLHIIASYLHVIGVFVEETGMSSTSVEDKIVNPLFMAAFNGTQEQE